MIRQEAHLVADVPDHLVEILARFTRNLRESSSVDQRSGVSARFAIAGAETIAAAALHRATSQGEDEAVARVVDLETAVDVLGGKIEFETGEEGRENEILTHLLRTATAETVRAPLPRPRLRAPRRRDRERHDGHDRRAGHRARLPRPGCRCWASPSCTTRSATGSAPPTTASGPAPSSSPSRGSTSPARSARSTGGGRDRLWLNRHTSKQARSRYGRYDGGDPLAPPVDIARGAGRDRPGRDGGLLAGAGDAGVPAPRRRRPARPRRPGPPGRRAAPRAAAAAQPRRHAPGDPGAARPGRARGAQAAGPRRRHGRRRPGVARDAAGEPPAQHRRRRERAVVVRLAEPGGPRGLREDQGPARPRAARPAVRRHEAGARERHRRGPRGDQRDARRPQRAAREAVSAARTPRRTSTSSWPSTGTSSRRTRRTSTSCSTRWRRAPPPPSGC